MLIHLTESERPQNLEVADEKVKDSQEKLNLKSDGS